MAWWFAAPLLILGAKKIYDVVTEDDKPSYSSSSTLSSAKASRTKLRKKLIREVILKNRQYLMSEVFNQKESSNISLDGSSSATDILGEQDFNTALDNLSDTIRLITPSYVDKSENYDGKLSVFTDISREVNNVANKAEMEYGLMAGIDQYNKYDKLSDAFVINLQSKQLI